MSQDRAPVLSELVLFTKLGEALKPQVGTMDIYADSMVIRPGPLTRVEAKRGVEWPTLSGEAIPFSHISQITGVVAGWLVKKTRIQVQTELTLVWEIRAIAKSYEVLRRTFEAWKSKAVSLK